MVLLSHIYFNLVANQFKYYKVSARITNSKSFRGWRAKAFVLADDCNGFYFGDESTTIYYENDDLSLAVLFKTKDEARKFRSTLEKRAFSFCIISSVLVNEVYEEVVLLSEAKEIRATHYVHGDSESPNHSLALSDYKSQADDESDAMSIADASDAYHTLQMIEDPNHPILYNRDLYRCHCESQASNKTERYNRNNMLILSWLTHQSFDGLNLVTKQHMVPSIAIGFIKFEGRETLELNKGYPLEKDRVTVSIESPDPKVLESVGLLLKKGSCLEKGKLLSFVHVDDHKEFERFLTIKYNETISLWRRNLKVGSVLPENEVPPSRRSKRIRTSKADS
jgi:hypothetical protein